MYPLVQVGPFRLSTGGLVLLLALFLAQWELTRRARRHGGETFAAQADQTFFAALLGAAAGGRLWYMIFNLDLLERTPSALWALRLSDWAWPGALLGGAGVAYLFCQWRKYKTAALADLAALALPVPQAIASAGLLLSGEAFGAPTSLPWAVSLFGTMRHPTQLYYAVAALCSFAILHWLARKETHVGALAVYGFLLQGITMLLIEPLRGDSLVLLGGLRAAQVVGLALVIISLMRLRRMSRSGNVPFSSPVPVDAHADGRA